MKIVKVERHEERKLVAVAGAKGVGLYLRKNEGSIYVGDVGTVIYLDQIPFEELLAECKDRTPIYEGDKITLEF